MLYNPKQLFLHFVLGQTNTIWLRFWIQLNVFIDPLILSSQKEGEGTSICFFLWWKKKFLSLTSVSPSLYFPLSSVFSLSRMTDGAPWPLLYLFLTSFALLFSIPVLRFSILNFCCSLVPSFFPSHFHFLLLFAFPCLCLPPATPPPPLGNPSPPSVWPWWIRSLSEQINLAKLMRLSEGINFVCVFVRVLVCERESVHLKYFIICGLYHFIYPCSHR